MHILSKPRRATAAGEVAAGAPSFVRLDMYSVEHPLALHTHTHHTDQGESAGPMRGENEQPAFGV